MTSDPSTSIRGDRMSRLEDRFQLPSRDQQMPGRAAARWASPLEVTVSVDTGLNHAVGRQQRPVHRPSAMMSKEVSTTSDDHQGILALAIRTSPPSSRHVTFSSPTIDGTHRPTKNSFCPSERDVDDQDTISRQRRFARSFSYTPDLDSPPDHADQVVADDCLLPPRSFRDAPDNVLRAPSAKINQNQRDLVPEERFVDGNYFFSQLDERREAEERQKTIDDYRRRQWRRRNVIDRLSTSLPVDYLDDGVPTSRLQRPNAGTGTGREVLDIPIRWPITDGRDRRGALQQPVQLRKQQLNTKDYLQQRPPLLTDISATEGRYHVGTGHFHEFRPISRRRFQNSPQLLNRTWSNNDPNVDRLSMSLDQSRFRRVMRTDDDDDDEALRPLHRRFKVQQHASTAELQERANHQSHNSLTVNRDESLGSDHPKVSPTGRKAVSWRDQEPFMLQEPTSTVNRQTRDTESTDEEALHRQTPLQTGSSHSYLDGSLSRSLQGSVSQMENIDQFALFEVSTSFLGWGESFMGTSWIDTIKQYKFVVLNRYEEVLFFGIEEDSSLSSCNLGPHKSSFKVRILDANGRDVIQFRRLYPFKPTTKLSLGTKRKYRLEVSTSSGRVIGNVEKTFDSDSYYVLEDRAGECLFVVQRSCICTCPLFWDYEFKVLIPGTDTEVGEIAWSYLTAHEENFNGTEISFPVELEATSKIMLLGVCFLLNFSRWQSSYLESVYNPKKRGNRKSNPAPDNSSTGKVLQQNSLSAPEWRRADVVTDDDGAGQASVQQNQINRRN